MRVYLKSYLCPHCETKCSFFGKGIGNSVALYCNSCKEGVYFQLSDSYDLPDNEDMAHINDSAIVDSYPRRVVTANITIPKDIADDFEEANKCISVEAKKATVTMCRLVLQKTCISKGCNPKTDLVTQIDELEAKRILILL